MFSWLWCFSLGQKQVIYSGDGGLRISSLHLSYCCPLLAHLYIWFLPIDFLANHVGNADLWGGKCSGISRRNYPVTIGFNAQRPWKRLVGTSQGRMHLPVCRPGWFYPGIRRALACLQTLYFLLINLPRFIFYYASSTDFADRRRNEVGGGGLKKGK